MRRERGLGSPQRGIIGRLSYANVIATVALFVALGGGAYAVSKLPANSVGSRQIKKNAVVSSKVKDSSLLGKDFKPGELPRGATGDPGATGPPGPTASSFSSHKPDQPVLFGTTETQVMALTDGTNGRSGGLLTLGFDGRILVNGSIALENDSSAVTIVLCRLKIAPQGGAFTPISQFTRVSIPPMGAAQIPLVGAIDEPAGTYNVNAGCLPAGTATYFFQGDLTAVASAR